MSTYTPIQHDRHFDDLADKFARSIYGSARGRLRLRLIRERMQAELPLSEPLSVLEAGGGLGQISAWLARQGHQVIMTEPANAMRERARSRIERHHGVVLASDIQTLVHQLPDPDQQFDLGVCHAVMEWLYQPEAVLPALFKHIKPGGWLSLMFFNEDALLMSNVIKGNWEKVLAGRLAGTGQRQRLTPISPRRPDQVLPWLTAQGFDVQYVSGIRVFHDYLRRQLPPQAKPELLVSLERRYMQQEPFWRLGRYILVHARKRHLVNQA